MRFPLLLPFAAAAVLALPTAALAQAAPAAAPSSHAAQPRRLDPARTALVFIEFQEEWIGETARLRQILVKDHAGFDRATSAAASVLATAREEGWHIVHAGLDLSTDPEYLIFGGGENAMGLRRVIPELRTWQAGAVDFVAPFEPRRGEFILRGRSGASVLQNSTLDAYLRNNGIDTIVLMGFATHVCVESTLRQGHDMGYNVYVVNDAVAPFEPTQQAYFEEHVLHHFGEGVTSAQLIQAMRGG